MNTVDCNFTSVPRSEKKAPFSALSVTVRGGPPMASGDGCFPSHVRQTPKSKSMPAHAGSEPVPSVCRALHRSPEPQPAVLAQPAGRLYEDHLKAPHFDFHTWKRNGVTDLQDRPTQVPKFYEAMIKGSTTTGPQKNTSVCIDNCPIYF